MKTTTRPIALLLSLLLLLCSVSVSIADEEEAKQRLRDFSEAYGQNKQSAVKMLIPLNHPKLVDAVAMIYKDEDTSRNRMSYEPIYIEADAVLVSADGPETFARMHHYLASNNLPRVRLRFMKGLVKLTDDTTLPVILKMVEKEQTPAMQYQMVKALGKYNDEDAYIMLFKLAKKSLNLDISAFAVNCLAKIKNEQTSELLLKLYNSKSGTPGAVRGSALTALNARNPEMVSDLLEEALKDSDAFVRAAACTLAAASARDDLASLIIANLGAKHWNLKSAAVRACGKLKLTDSVGALIELWKKEKGRLEEDIHKALLAITGKSFGPYWQYWDNWFKNNDGKVDPSDKEGEYISYHGLKTRSKNIAFIIDHSGSMTEKVKSKHGGYVGEGAVIKGDTKMAMVKAELIRVIKSLPKDTKFNIVGFESKVIMWKKGQTIAKKKEKESAIKWVEKLTPGGMTNIYDALLEGFGRLTPGGKVNKEYKSGPDTIFLLSDGRPTAGTISNPVEILKAIKELNKIRQVTIHTIGVGKMTKMFLEPLAQQNNGTFKLIAE